VIHQEERLRVAQQQRMRRKRGWPWRRVRNEAGIQPDERDIRVHDASGWEI
jgi:hypothetical protein